MHSLQSNIVILSKVLHYTALQLKSHDERMFLFLALDWLAQTFAWFGLVKKNDGELYPATKLYQVNAAAY